MIFCFRYFFIIYLHTLTNITNKKYFKKYNLTMSKKRNNINVDIPNIVGISNIARLRLMHDKKYKKPSKNTKHLSNIDAFDDSVNVNTINNHELVSSDLRYERDIYNQMMLGTNLFDNGIRRASSFFELTDEVKARRLIQIAKDDIISDVVDKLSEEIIQYNTESEFAKISINTKKLSKLSKTKFNTKTLKKIQSILDRAFVDTVRMLNFNRGGINKYVEYFLIEGKVAFEIVYNDITKPTKIIDIIEVNPYKIVPYYFNGQKYWIHKRETVAKQDQIIVFDNQVNFVDWREISANNRMSYVEGLIRRYNMLKAIEDSRLLAGITAGIFRTVTKIPTRNKSRIDAATTMATEASRLSESITIESDSGELRINGSTNMLSMKQAFQAEGDSGSPSIEAIDNSGIQLDDNGLETYTKRYNKSSRIPFSRFDDSGSSWNIDANSQLREEISFGNYVDKIRLVFSKLILKPCIITLLLEMPELVTEEDIIESIFIDFTTNNYFRDQLEKEVAKSNIEFIDAMYNAAIFTTPDGVESPLLSRKLLLKEHLHLTDDYFEEHRKEIERELKQVQTNIQSYNSDMGIGDENNTDDTNN